MERLSVYGTEDASSILATITKAFDFLEKILYNMYRKGRIANLVNAAV